MADTREAMRSRNWSSRSLSMGWREVGKTSNNEYYVNF